MPTGSPVRMKLTKEQREKLATLGQRYIKSADPTVNDDSEAGYARWDKWLNQTTKEAYVCLDATEGAADWQNMSLDADDLAGLFDAKVDKVPGSSLVADTEIAKIHTQDTDQYLDKGGANEVSAAQIATLKNTTVPAKADKDTDAVAGNLLQAVSGGGYEDSGIPAESITVAYNHIGTPGWQGYGVGIIPESMLPDNMTAMDGTTTKGHDNWGNYQRDDGSVDVWVPAFYLKIGTGANGLGVNQMTTLPFSAFADEAAANLAGYMLPRAFRDGGNTYYGFFYDKYKASKIAWGTGYIAGSVKNGLPISTSSAHNPIADLTNCTANAYYEAINAAKAVGGVDGAAAADPQWHCASRFQAVTLAFLAAAHGQAARSTAYCAWFDATGVKNYPKGCNNNALADTDDTSVVWESDGYSNCGKTGSAGYGGGAGNVFAKSTHNGQNCGVADVNGLMWEINLGITCVASTVNITAVNNANPCQVTAVGHGRTTGDPVMILSVGGTTQINDKIFTLTRVDDNNFTLDGVDATAFGVYTSGGTAVVGDFYVADEATAMKDFTSGNTLATDHWGATGVAAMMASVSPAFVTGYPANGFAQRMGSGANQVLSEALTGNANILTNLGIPKDIDGADTTGTNLFGKDYFYQYIRNELCVISAGGWSSTSNAGVWNSYWYNARTNSYNSVGFRCACYPEKAAIAA